MPTYKIKECESDNSKPSSSSSKTTTTTITTTLDNYKSTEKLCASSDDDLATTSALDEDKTTTSTGKSTVPANRYLAVLHNFCMVTSAHGWGRVAKSQNPGVRLMWVAITVCALVLVAIHVSALTVLYLQFSSEYKLQTAVRVVEFPSVTICNLLPMSPSTKKQLLQDEASAIAQWEHILDTMDRFDQVAGDLGKADEYEVIKMRLREPSGYFDNIGDEAVVVGHQKRDFVLGCTVGTDSCDVFYNFSLFQTRDFYNCYTFNNNDQGMMAKITGPAAGLSLILYLENKDGGELVKETYHPMWNLGNSAGVRIVVHPPRSQPNPAEEGFNVPPGNSANVALGVRTYGRLSAPYGDCVPRTDQTTAFGNGEGHFVYSMSACLSVCRQLYIVQKCRCLSSLLPIPASLTSLHLNLTYCAKWDVEDVDDLVRYFDRVECEATATEDFAVNEQEFQRQCRCYPLCEEDDYLTKFSYSQWPVEYTQESFYETYVLGNPRFWDLKAFQNLRQLNVSEMVDAGLISANFVRVNIFLQSFVIEEYSQKASHSPANFVSAIGGTFGLWVGMSVITWCEVVQLVCSVVFMKIIESAKRFRRWYKKKTKSQDEDDTKPDTKTTTQTEENSQ